MIKKKINVVFQGGGVKGSAYPGALQVIEDENYTVESAGGVSAGAIVAALVAAGYSASEIRDIMDDTDYNKFCDKWATGYVPFFGKALSVLCHDGFYKGDYFENWIASLLKAKGVEKYGDLKIKGDYKLKVVTSDLSFSRGVLIPDHLEKLYGVDPDNFSVARSIRMSMSIPFFFKQTHIIDQFGKKVFFVDGGMTSNMPLFIFKNSKIPTIGIFLRDKTFKFDDEKEYRDVSGCYDNIKALIDIVSGGMDYLHIDEEDWNNRIILIDTLGISTTDFDISSMHKDMLYFSGYNSAVDFFHLVKQRKKTIKAKRKRKYIL